MDPVTHILSGGLIARATAPAQPRAEQLSTRARVFAGLAAAGFPDADFFVRFIDPLTYLAYHRSYLNSIVLMPVWAVALAFLFSSLSRGRYSWRAFIGVCFLALGIHIVGDLITSFGSMIFAPVSFARLAWDATFIIDPYFSAIIGAGLIASLVWKRTRVPSALALVALVAYVGFQALLHERALSVADQYAHANELIGAKTHALPQPLSPFNWMLVVTHQNTYHLAYVNLLRKKIPNEPPATAGMLQKITASYRPAQHAVWQRVPRFGKPVSVSRFVQAVWEQDALRTYRHFALFPALYRIDRHDSTCVWFRDFRFALVGREPVFPFGLCRDHDSQPWRLHRLTAAGKTQLLAD
ncbi:MAG: metal-dependent hydrolase [Acidiferrobacterales bacterium]